MQNNTYRVRPASLFADGQKLGTMQNSTVDVNSNDEMLIIEEGYGGHSDGAITSRVQGTKIVPYGDTRLQLIRTLVEKRYVTMTIVGLDGASYQITGRFLSASYKSDHKSGSLMGDFTFEGGKPELVG